ncbi:unnamed protein product [Heligmosomoides polygyrus]|uniref:Reverse transcriptase domain-containing protein n=1 Tax=Heligmosomoides polygyrus TaxID=6339 RepID=A0A183G9K9_HELPZ|nr:unnamed protein product [Heligmosomoides polygyrus]
MKSLNWDEKGICVDRKFLLNHRFADDIVIFTMTTAEAETMLKELNEAGMKIGLRITRKKTQFMKNVWCEGDNINIDGSLLTGAISYVYLGRSINIDNDKKEELSRRRKAAWSAYGSLKEANGLSI